MNDMEYITIPKIWRSVLDSVPLDGSVIEIRYKNPNGGMEYRKIFVEDANDIMMNLIKKHPDAEYCLLEGISDYWNLVTNPPIVKSHYLCKSNNKLYGVEYFDGEKFSHNESNWIRFWRELEYNTTN